MISFRRELAVVRAACRVLGDKIKTKENSETGLQGKTVKAKPMIFSTEEELMQVKSIVFMHVFLIFEQNPDVKSYVFTGLMIKASRVGK